MNIDFKEITSWSIINLPYNIQMLRVGYIYGYKIQGDLILSLGNLGSLSLDK